MLHGLSKKYEYQAELLGAGRLSIFYYIILPHIVPGVVAGAGIAFLVSMSQYISTLIIGGGNVITLPTIMVPYISGGEYSMASGLIVLFTLIAIVPLYIMDYFLKKYYFYKLRIAI